MFVTLMWTWSYFSLIMGNMNQLNEVANSFGVDFPVIIGLCTSFPPFLVAYTIYMTFFLSLHFPHDVSTSQLLFVFIRSVSMVHFVGVLNVVVSVQERSSKYATCLFNVSCGCSQDLKTEPQTSTLSFRDRESGERDSLKFMKEQGSILLKIPNQDDLLQNFFECLGMTDINKGSSFLEWLH